jgi:hypothetical protein
MVPPACEKIQRTSRKRLALPLNSTDAIVRVVSVPNSIITGWTLACRLPQQLAAVGCVYTTALRRFSSSMMGKYDGSPSHLSP